MLVIKFHHQFLGCISNQVNTELERGGIKSKRKKTIRKRGKRRRQRRKKRRGKREEDRGEENG